MSNATFDFNVFIKDSKESIMNPKEYFSAMRTEGGLGEPIIKAVIYGLIAGVIGFIWSLLNIGAVGGGLFGGAVGIMILIGSVIGAIIGVFIGGVVVLIISAICGGKTDFEPNMRIAASLMVLMPISTFFGFAGSIHYILGILVGFAINLYGLWMLYHALTQTLGGKEATAKILGYVLAALLVLFLLIGFATRRAVSKFDKWGSEYVNEWEEAGKEWEKASKEMEKQAKKLEEEMQKALEEIEVEEVEEVPEEEQQ
jgi:hypothetical protein